MWQQTAEEIIMDEICVCGKNTTRKTSWTDLNLGRRYVVCKKFKQVDGCAYFMWLDPPMCTRARQIIPGLLRRVNRFEEDLKKKSKRERLFWVALLVSWAIMFIMAM
ncbi:hypothetical protein BUALT_Bualt14G0024200 [Buddleja alternifolia]|uniref:GRF-type domain-containing protein n=1 Tax=Buddleja alternifolia TaxID=168488 RepID=A0AAV6WNC2_9LAMI|nr:hypothetical protein BUALT_Bualt14G0024200 [Buddleja alternifolia]